MPGEKLFRFSFLRSVVRKISIWFQLILKGDLGMDVEQFMDMLLLMRARRKEWIFRECPGFQEHSFVWFQDLDCIHRILSDAIACNRAENDFLSITVRTEVENAVLSRV